MDAVILAAGKGLRLRPFTETKPKGLVDIAGKPLLQYTLESLPKTISHINFVIGFLGDQIKTHFGDQFNNTPISYYTQDPLNGTGTAVKLVKENIKESFLVVNGDDLYSPEDLEKLASTECGILVHQENGILETGVLSQNNLMTGLGANLPDSPAYRVCGAYKLPLEYFDFPPVPIPVRGNVEFSLPHTLATIAHQFKIEVVTATFWQPVGTPEELEKAGKIKGPGISA